MGWKTLGSRRVSRMRSQRDQRMLQICFVKEAANGDVVVTFLMPQLSQPGDNTQCMHALSLSEVWAPFDGRRKTSANLQSNGHG